MSVSLAAVAILSTAPSAQASSGFCASGVAYDYAAPFERMPRPRAVPPDHTLPFGPRGVYLSPMEQSDHLLVRWGRSLVSGPFPARARVGYSIAIPPPGSKFGNPRLPVLDWLATAKLFRIDAQGRTKRLIAWKRMRIRGLAESGWLQLEPSRKLGFYRTQIVFRNGAGKRLGRFAEYFRVARAASDVRLTLDSAWYRPGDTVSSCLENFGTMSPTYGACEPAIESHDGVAWAAFPPGEVRYCILIAKGLGAGRAELLNRYTIPDDAPPGRYRARVNEVTTEFQVLAPG